MQDADRKLLWSAVLVMAVIALELAWVLFVGPANQSAHQAAQQAGDQYAPWWQYSGTWIAFFTLVLTVSTALLWWQTRGLAKVGRDQTDAEFRPWVQLLDISLGYDGLVLDRNGINVSLITKCKNVGRTPALYLSFRIQPIFMPLTTGDGERDRDRVLIAQDEYCARVRKRDLTTRARGTTVFPAEVHELNFGYGGGGSAADIERVKARQAEVGTVLILVVGCISYYSPSDDRSNHQTRFAYEIRSHGKPLLIPDSGSEHWGPLELSLWPWFQSGAFEAD